MKRIFLLCLVVLFSLLAVVPGFAEFDLSQSGLSVSGQAQQLGKPSSYGSEKILVPIPDENAAQSGINPITGESWQGNYQPVLVNIDSHPRALPHWGVASADLIYELPIQADGSTRQVALFMSEYPELTGPVRSARIPMASLAEMWGAPYYFFGYQGGTTSVKEWVQKYSANRKFSYPYTELMNKKKGVWYERTNDGGHVAPYNVTLIMDKVKEEYSLTPKTHSFLFDDTGLTRGETVNGIVIPYKTTSPAYLSAYQYNEATGLYDRYRNGEPYTDMLTGESTSFANVIVIRTNVSFMNNNPSRPVIRLNGQGVCEIFQNGRYIRGTWVRNCTETKNLGNRMIFLDENGNEIPMKVGKTFIQIVDNEQPVIAVSDEAIEGSIEPQVQRLMIGDGTNTNSTTKRPKATRTPRPTRTPEPTATPEPVIPEPEQTEPEQTQPEQSQPEQSEPEQTQPEQTQPEQSQPEQSEPEQSQPEQTQPEQSQPEQSEPEQTQPEQSEPEQSQPEHSEPEQTQPEQSQPEQVKPEETQPAQSEQTEPEQTAQEQPESEKAEEKQPEQREPEQTELQQAEPEQDEPQQAEPQQTEPEQVESQQTESEQVE